MQVEVSLGELVDKITILQIKDKKFTDDNKRQNVRKELAYLLPEMEKAGFALSSPHYTALVVVNEKLWEIEDRLRVKEAGKQFDAEFVELARSVYYTNDERANIKKAINLEYNSALIEEKQYCEYK